MNTRKYSKTQEKRVAKTIKGKVVPNSGATAFLKGDVTTDHFCIECKTAVTEKQSFSIKKEWIEKLKEEMFAVNKSKWAVVFNFGGLDNRENFYILSEEDFRDYLRLLSKEEEENGYEV